MTLETTAFKSKTGVCYLKSVRFPVSQMIALHTLIESRKYCFVRPFYKDVSSCYTGQLFTVNEMVTGARSNRRIRILFIDQTSFILYIVILLFTDELF